ncbi:MAG: NAD-dependent histone deacetylase SIR2 [Streblomastix strix]|uniref:NAD-dependent histone deacetylase SIR2 n=1 Tax=Streblomastix strix TaxID=222440 RepID=A0A5J4X6X1_9EUKA|nr:MAG: NAD-dependent histone deacetylase SIR2 [Streblomastix strix]
MRLPQYQTFDDAVDLIRNSKRIVVIVGAGISVSCGIPDFRSKGGFYEMIRKHGLDQPELIFDYQFFQRDPSLFYHFGKSVLPSNFIPSFTHFFLSWLDQAGKILRIFTQNIDNLEKKAGVRNVVQCHGSMGDASCLRCGHRVRIEDIQDKLEREEIAYCRICCPDEIDNDDKQSKDSDYIENIESEYENKIDEHILKSLPPIPQERLPVYKPSVVFFGEQLPLAFHYTRSKLLRNLSQYNIENLLIDDEEDLHSDANIENENDADQITDKDVCDCLIVIGSSLEVKPVCTLIYEFDEVQELSKTGQEEQENEDEMNRQIIHKQIPQILINRDIVGQRNHFDINLQGDCDDICLEIARSLGIPIGSLENERKIEMIKDMEKDNIESTKEQEQQNDAYSRAIPFTLQERKREILRIENEYRQRHGLEVLQQESIDNQIKKEDSNQKETKMIRQKEKKESYEDMKRMIEIENDEEEIQEELNEKEEQLAKEKEEKQNNLQSEVEGMAGSDNDGENEHFKHHQDLKRSKGNTKNQQQSNMEDFSQNKNKNKKDLLPVLGDRHEGLSRSFVLATSCKGQVEVTEFSDSDESQKMKNIIKPNQHKQHHQKKPGN